MTFTRRFPRGIFEFAAAVKGWQLRIGAYYWGIPREYPPFALQANDYPLRSRFAYPENGIARWRPLLQAWLIAPRSIFVSMAIGLRAMCRFYLAMWSVLLFGRYPHASYRSAVRTLLWQDRNWAYKNFMVDRYPPTFAQTPAP